MFLLKFPVFDTELPVRNQYFVRFSPSIVQRMTHQSSSMGFIIFVMLIKY